MSYGEDIRHMANACRQDPVYIDGIKAALIESGMAAMCGLAVDESKLDPWRPMPANWSAMQLSLFDNGEIEPGRKRPMIQRTKTRFGAKIKVWTKPDPNFSTASQVAWCANIYMLEAEAAIQASEELATQKLVDRETVEMMRTLVDGLGDGFKYAIPVLKRHGDGTRWMRQHVVTIGFDGDRPTNLVVTSPNVSFQADEWADVQANGLAFRDRVIAQARVARANNLASWATSIL